MPTGPLSVRVRLPMAGGNDPSAYGKSVVLDGKYSPVYSSSDPSNRSSDPLRSTALTTPLMA